VHKKNEKLKRETTNNGQLKKSSYVKMVSDFKKAAIIMFTQQFTLSPSPDTDS